MNSLRDRAAYFARTATGFADLLRTPLLRNQADLIRDRLRNREKNFLEFAKAAVFENPSNPYREMFGLAGCEYDDLAAAVKRDGIEATLTVLHRQGVYLRHDEFKLKTAIVRSNRTVAADEKSFKNPLSRGGVAGPTGGSRSRGTNVRVSTQARLQREAYDRITIEEFGLAKRRLVLLKPILPATDGLFNLASYTRLGCTPDRWFSQVARSSDSIHYRAATRFLVALAWARGCRIPKPADLPYNDFSPVAQWLERRGRQQIDTVLISYASPAVRVASAALQLDLRLDRTLFFVGGETLTEAKRRTIECTGAEVFPRYSISEFGAVGCSCRHMRGDCVHLFSDSIAAIAHRRPAPFSDQPVDSLLLTSIAPHAPYFLLNVEMDDCGTIAPASCDCTFSRLGLTTAINDICSFGKLTGHGMTLFGTDIVRILEQALPARFGGSATDYQLVEGEPSGQTKLTLRVSRRLRLNSLDEVKSCFLQELRAYFGGESASRLLRDAAAVEVVHEDPISTDRGKIMPLHLLGSGGPTPGSGTRTLSAHK